MTDDVGFAVALIVAGGFALIYLMAFVSSVKRIRKFNRERKQSKQK